MAVESIMYLGLMSHAERKDAKGADCFWVVASVDLCTVVTYGEVGKLMGINNGPVDGTRVYIDGIRSEKIITSDSYNMKLFAVTPEQAMEALKKDMRNAGNIRRLRMAIRLLTDFCKELKGDIHQLGVVFYGY